MKKTALKRGNSRLKRSGFSKRPKSPLSNKKRTMKRILPTKGKRMVYGVKVWSMKKADIEFSQWLRTQKGYSCEMCGYYEAPPTKKIQCSHYIGRSHKATRYDPDNCDVLCASCHHRMEDLKQYDYRDWKIKKMGEEAHTKLRQKGNGTLGEKDAIYNCMILLGKL